MALALLGSATLWILIMVLPMHRIAVAFPLLQEAKTSHVSFRRPVPRSPSLVVHLDLKGSPPTLPFLQKFLNLIALEGADGLLIEYEDMFPFEGRIANLSARNAYSKSEVQQILGWAEELGLHVIPLVQTFGHLEYALKQEEFRDLRELRSFPQELCPSNPKSMILVSEIVQQVMALHTPSSRFLHVGCDEVYHMNACGRCTARKLSHSALFEEHVLSVVRMVRSKFPGVTPLMWDDMLRKFPAHELSQSPLSELVEPVVWVYERDISKLVPNYKWFSMGKTFPRVWGAAAYRGASGAFAPVPNVNERLQNVVAWRRRQILQGAGEPAPAPAALVLTGWARYDHFASLTELLPLSVPSLVLALQTARAAKPLREDDAAPPRAGGWLGGAAQEDGWQKILKRWRNSLHCPRWEHWSTLQEDPRQWALHKCRFLGQDMFAAVHQCHLAHKALRTVEEDNKENEVQGWLTEYHMARRFSSPFRVLGSLNELLAVRAQFADCRQITTHALKGYVDNHTALEWLAQRVEPAERRLDALEKAAAQLATVDVWPRRPLD